MFQYISTPGLPKANIHTDENSELIKVEYNTWWL